LLDVRAGLHCHVTAMPHLISGEEFVTTLLDLGITHIVWVPDSEFGPWESTLEASELQLVRVCREGEAWPLAAGLHLGGARPVILMQTTGLFESGDALRNTLFDLGLPLLAVIGARNWLVEDSPDTAKQFAAPILKAWGVDYTVIESPEQASRLADHFRACQSAGQAGIAVLAEGPG
jgi:sulfopyruvate decarboxylase TPP-binding subunit